MKWRSTKLLLEKRELDWSVKLVRGVLLFLQSSDGVEQSLREADGPTKLDLYPAVAVT